MIIEKDGCVIDIVGHCETMLTEYGVYNVPSCQEVNEDEMITKNVDFVVDVDYETFKTKMRNVDTYDWTNDEIDDLLSSLLEIKVVDIN